MYFTGNYNIQLKMTLAQAKSASHPGQCDDDVLALSRVPTIARQLRKLSPDSVRRELSEYGAWSADELSDHDANLQRILWIAACDINERTVK